MPKSKHVDEEIGKLIAAARKRQKMTREVTAERIGISYPMLQRHERGLSPVSVSRLLQLAEVLGVPPASLLPGLQAKSEKELLVTDAQERSLVQAFRGLKSEAVGDQVVKLVRTMSAAEKGR